MRDYVGTLHSWYLALKPILSDVADLYLTYRSVLLAHNYTKRLRGKDVGIAQRKAEESGKPRGWRKQSRDISWSGAPSDALRDCIASVTVSGAAMLFARTPDGGALVVKVYAGDTQSKEYCTEIGDLPDLLAWIVEQYG